MARGRRARRAQSAALFGSSKLEPSSERGLAVGWLAMVPLLFAYELGLEGEGLEGPRNFAELLLLRGLTLFGSAEGTLRIVLLLGLSVAALARVRQAQLSLGKLLTRAVIEGGACALLLGPLLLVALYLFGLGAEDLGLAPLPPEVPADFERVLRAFGAGAWEELAFRVGAFSALYLVARTLARAVSASEAWADAIGDGVAAFGSSILFAACHLDGVMGVVGLRGEAWDERVFLWRVLAGLFFAGLFRLRGPGAAAWCHGLFNLALILGAGPGVFR